MTLLVGSESEGAGSAETISAKKDRTFRVTCTVSGTLSALGVKLSSVPVTGNIYLAIREEEGNTNKPKVGTPLAETAAFAAKTGTNEPATTAVGTVKVKAGTVYWIEIDNDTAEKVGYKQPSSASTLYTQNEHPGSVTSPSTMEGWSTAVTGGPIAIWASGTEEAGPPVVTKPEQQETVAGAAGEYQVVASGSPTGYTASGLPKGLSINTSTGKVTGTAEKAEEVTVTVTATNSHGTGETTFVWIILTTSEARLVKTGLYSETATFNPAAIPTAATDLVLQENFNLEINKSEPCRSLVAASNYKGVLSHKKTFNLTVGTSSAPPGNIALKLLTTMTYTAELESKIILQSTQTNLKLFLAKHTIEYLEVLEGTYYLEEEANVNLLIMATAGILHLAATLTTKKVTGTAGKLYLGAQELKLTGTGRLIETVSVVTAETSTLVISDTSETEKELPKGEYNNVLVTGANLTITSGATPTVLAGNLTLENAGRTKTKLFGGQVTKVKSLIAKGGTEGSLVKFGSVSTPAKLEITTPGVYTLEYVEPNSVEILGAGVEVYAVHSVDGGSNTNIKFETPPVGTHASMII